MKKKKLEEIFHWLFKGNEEWVGRTIQIREKGDRLPLNNNKQDKHP